MQRPVWISALCLVASACGSSGGAVPGAKANVAQSEDVARYIDAYCTKALTCQTASSQYASHDGCVRVSELIFGCGGTAQSKLKLPDLDRCLRALDAANCAAPVDLPECASVTQAITTALESDLGVPAEGEPCTTSCRTGFTCRVSTSGCGTCVKEAALGAPCIDDRDCSTEAFCASSSTCAQRHAPGEACSASHECARGLCEGGVCSVHVTKLGDPCKDGSLDCGGTLRCIAGACAALGKPGEACAMDSPFECVSEAACVAGKCELTAACEVGGVGAACISSRQCQSGLGCQLASGTCQMALPSGAACSADSEPCAEGLVCAAVRNSSARTCAPIAAPADCAAN